MSETKILGLGADIIDYTKNGEINVDGALDTLFTRASIIDGEVEYYKDLPTASEHNGETYLVKSYDVLTPTRLTGLYYCSGTSWDRRSDKVVYSVSPFTSTNKLTKTYDNNRQVIETPIEIDNSNNLDLKDGGLKDTNVINKVTLGDIDNTSLETDNQSLIGAINEVYKNPLSCGIVDITPPVLTDNGDGTATIAGCKVALHSNANATGSIKTYDIAQATFTFTNGAQEYVIANYNNGNPIYEKVSSAAGITGSDKVIIYFVWRQGNTIHSSDQDSVGLGFSNKINRRMLLTEPYRIARATPFSLNETATPTARTITCTGATVFKGVAEENVLAFNSSTDKLYEVVSTAGGWTYTQRAVYDNLSYNPANSSKLTMLAQKWAYRMYYRSIGDAKELFYVLSPQEYTSSALALDGVKTGRSDLPVLLRNHCVLVGYSLIEYNATNGTTASITENTITAIPSTSAGNVSLIPTGNISATNVQSAIEELDTEKTSSNVANTWTATQDFNNVPMTVSGELIVETANRDFSAVNNWTGATWVTSGGRYYHSTAGIGEAYLPTLLLQIGKSYLITISIFTTTPSPTGIRVYASNIGSNFFGKTTAGLSNITIPLNNVTNTGYVRLVPDNSWTGFIDDISVKEITENISYFSVKDGTYNYNNKLVCNKWNVGFGVEVLRNCNSPFNIGMGYLALSKLYAGTDNTAYGHYSLNNSLNCYYNSSFGSSSLSENVSGSGNSAFGQNSLKSNITGQYNSSFGKQALETNKDGNYNTAFGIFSLQNVEGSYNTAFGSTTASSLTSGSYNCYFGYNAGGDKTSGNNNVVIGYNAKNLGNDSNSIVIGYNTIGNTSNTVTIGNTNITDTYLRGYVQSNKGFRIQDNTNTASISIAGVLRYRTDSNNSYCEMCMQTGATTYEWVIIKQNTW